MYCENKNKYSGKHLIQESGYLWGKKGMRSREFHRGYYHIYNALFLKLFVKKTGIHHIILCILSYAWNIK